MERSMKISWMVAGGVCSAPLKEYHPAHDIDILVSFCQIGVVLLGRLGQVTI